MTFELPKLTFEKTDLEPYISKNTLDFHYDKHHQGYVNNLNNLTKGTELENLPLEKVVRETYQNPEKTGVFNNAAQVWNHSFFWNSMKKNGGGEATGALKAKIDADFGSYEKFAEEFKTAAATQFGSGWAWLIVEAGKLKIVKTSNADTPLARGQVALLCVDVWEHAYYLDYQNRRPDFVAAFLANLVNWDFANANLAKA
ncbi:MAG: superoxide dismutase [Alphaproteobacteria bacterium]